MNHRNNFFLLLTGAIVFGACVKTEIIPEVLEPTLRLEPSSVSLTVGQTRQLTGVYTNAQGEDQSNLIQWATTNPAIAAVNAAGLLSAKAAGQAWIVATVAGGFADSTLVTVVQNDNSVAKVVISTATSVLGIGATFQLAAKAYNTNNQEIPGQQLSWSSSNPLVLSVNPNGLVTGQSAGSAYVTAFAAGVNSLPLSIQVLPASGLSRSGTFSGNMGYSVSGTATLQQTGNGLQLILGSNFQASSGPQLGVFLAKTASGALNAQNSLKLANLIQNSGMQTYNVPAGVDLNDYDYIVIYCIPFTVRFGTAQLNN